MRAGVSSAAGGRASSRCSCLSEVSCAVIREGDSSAAGGSLHWSAVRSAPIDCSSSTGAGSSSSATLLPGMRQLTEAEGFPVLDPLRIGLFYKHPRLTASGLQLVSDLVASIESVGAGIRVLPN